VADFPGVTRDRIYGEGVVGDKPYIIVDTGGINEPDNPEMAKHTDEQVAQAIQEANQLLFIVDAKSGLASADETIANQLREHKDKVTLVINKADSDDVDMVRSEFYALGFGDAKVISATRGRGIQNMMEELLAPYSAEEISDDMEQGIRMAIIGRPNVGKSTLTNRMLGEERVVVFDQPGTTRDAIFIPYERRGKHYTLIDTAGVRRKAKVHDAIEKFSIIKAMQAISRADVVLVVVDAQENITDQDLKLIGHVLERGKALVVAVNKWDGLDDYQRERIKQELDRRLQFISFARRYFISALHGTNVGKLYDAVHEAYDALHQEFSTSMLTRVLEQALKDHQPPLVRGRRIKLRYAHLGGLNPLQIIIHGKQTKSTPGSYQRYLANYFRDSFKLVGVPVVIRFKQDENPYDK
jgi:GTPase